MNKEIQLELRKFVSPEFIFGLDARKLIASYSAKLGARKVFLATDRDIMNTLWFNEIILVLDEHGIEYSIFYEISPNPRDYEVMNGAERYLSENCNMIIAVGGGSVIDCAKGIGIVSTNKKNIEQFEGIDEVSQPIPPLICIPTTSGSSADVSQFAIINNTKEKYKMALISKALVPDVALIDPFVLTSMNNYFTACTGMDALSHAFEAFVSNAYSSFTDLYALEAIKLIHENILETIIHPYDIQRRGKMMLASLYAGLAFSNASLGCVHSLAHSLGGYLDLPHGECNAILLPHVVNYNFDSAADRYKTIAKTLEIETKNLTDNQIKKQLSTYLLDLKNKINIPDTLKDKGITADIIPILATKAINDPCNATNPRPPVQKDLEVIYSEAI